MALESGEILARAIDSNSSIAIITENYKQLHQQKFQKRLRICGLIRRAAFAPNLAKWVISAP